MTTNVMPALPVVEFKHVLVPVDGSELALQAMPTARALAERFGADLQTVTVAEGDGALRAQRFAAAALDVDTGDERAFVAPGGDPAEAIVKRAESLGSCLVCLATHGRGRLSGALIGSVARAVVKRSAAPVIVLGPSADNPGWSPRPRSWPEPLSVPRIVVCVDGTSTSEQILPYAAGWAQALGMSLSILTVISEGMSHADSHGAEHRYGADGDAQTYVDGLIRTWRSELSAVDGLVLRDPIGPASAIRSHLDERPAGLLALTTHARSGMQRVVLGAAAAGIVHASVSPCLVVSAHG